MTGKTRKEYNDMLIDRIKGVPSQPATPESDADARNPNKTRATGPTHSPARQRAES